MSSTAPRPGDKAAAFVGLIGGALLTGLVVYTIVHLTNAKYAGHAEGGSAPAAQTQPAH